MENYLEVTIVTTTKRKIQTEQIKDTNIYAYWEEIDIELNGKVIKEKKFGITSFENLRKVKDLEPINDKIKDEKLYNGFGFVCGIKKEDLNNLFSGKNHITDVIIEINEKEYNSNNYELVIWNPGSYKILDLYGNFISIPFNFGYIDGELNDYKYDLNKLLEVLKNDKNVCDRKNIKITYIPYYNATEEKTKSIEFKYLLPTDIYQELMRKKIDNYDMYNYIINNIMNIKECEKETI